MLIGAQNLLHRCRKSAAQVSQMLILAQKSAAQVSQIPIWATKSDAQVSQMATVANPLHRCRKWQFWHQIRCTGVANFDFGIFAPEWRSKNLFKESIQKSCARQLCTLFH